MALSKVVATKPMESMAVAKISENSFPRIQIKDCPKPRIFHPTPRLPKAPYYLGAYSRILRNGHHDACCMVTTVETYISIRWGIWRLHYIITDAIIGRRKKD